MAMGKPSFRTRVRRAAEGLKARVSASPDIWDEVPENEGDWTPEMGGVAEWLELPQGYRAPDDDDTAYRRWSSFDMSRAGDDGDGSEWAADE
jgi:hypothetical protein